MGTHGAGHIEILGDYQFDKKETNCIKENIHWKTYQDGNILLKVSSNSPQLQRDTLVSTFQCLIAS